MRTIALYVVASVGLSTNISARAPQQRGQEESQKPSIWVLEQELDTSKYKESIWNGYPSKEWLPVEAEVEQRVRDIRKKAGLPDVVVLEELRFIARGHARDGEENGDEKRDHKSQYWGYVSDRASVLFGWKPAIWALCSSKPFPSKYFIADNYAPGRHTAEKLVRGWMGSPPHREAILYQNIRTVGMGMSGANPGTRHLVFMSLPKEKYDVLIGLKPLYEKLRKAKGVSQVKAIMRVILRHKEGSSVIHILPLLRAESRAFRTVALASLENLYRLVPETKGIIFGLVDWGTTSDYPDVRQGAEKLLRRITKQKLKSSEDWRRWWNENWKTFGKK